MTAREREAWTVKGGEKGEYEADALDRGIALLGFREVPDLTPASTREAIKDLVRIAYPNDNDHSHNNVTSQLFAFRVRIGKGDIVAMPLKSIPGFVAVGCVKSEYQYAEIDGEKRHTLQVTWRESHIDKSSIGPDLLSSLSVRKTVSHPRAKDSNQRLIAIYEHGVDPLIATDAVNGDDVDSYVIAQAPQEAILDRVHTRFPGRELERLVRAILEAEGYVAEQSPKGADQGVDVLAGRGPMGFDPPRLCVQVKHTGSPIGDGDIQNLSGVFSRFSAEHGLFVSWGGYTAAAKREARRQFFTLRLWNANDLIDAICRNYDRLPEDIRAEIPLKQVWTLVEDDDL